VNPSGVIASRDPISSNPTGQNWNQGVHKTQNVGANRGSDSYGNTSGTGSTYSRSSRGGYQGSNPQSGHHSDSRNRRNFGAQDGNFNRTNHQDQYSGGHNQESQYEGENEDHSWQQGYGYQEESGYSEANQGQRYFDSKGGNRENFQNEGFPGMPGSKAKQFGAPSPDFFEATNPGMRNAAQGSYRGSNYDGEGNRNVRQPQSNQHQIQDRRQQYGQTQANHMNQQAYQGGDYSANYKAAGAPGQSSIKPQQHSPGRNPLICSQDRKA